MTVMMSGVGARLTFLRARCTIRMCLELCVVYKSRAAQRSKGNESGMYNSTDIMSQRAMMMMISSHSQTCVHRASNRRTTSSDRGANLKWHLWPVARAMGLFPPIAFSDSFRAPDPFNRARRIRQTNTCLSLKILTIIYWVTIKRACRASYISQAPHERRDPPFRKRVSKR